MENMDKGLTVPKWVLIVRPKIPQMPQILSAQFVCPSPKVLDFIEKRLHWASVVCDSKHRYFSVRSKNAKKESQVRAKLNTMGDFQQNIFRKYHIKYLILL